MLVCSSIPNYLDTRLKKFSIQQQNYNQANNLTVPMKALNQKIEEVVLYPNKIRRRTSTWEEGLVLSVKQSTRALHLAVQLSRTPSR